MTDRDFIYWLHGYFEISGNFILSNEQIYMIKKHINLVQKERKEFSDHSAVIEWINEKINNWYNLVDNDLKLWIVTEISNRLNLIMARIAIDSFVFETSEDFFKSKKSISSNQLGLEILTHITC
jgi:hypothetical protein